MKTEVLNRFRLTLDLLPHLSQEFRDSVVGQARNILHDKVSDDSSYEDAVLTIMNNIDKNSIGIIFNLYFL